jgi:hypothetical protein
MAVSLMLGAAYWHGLTMPDSKMHGDGERVVLRDR